MIRFLFFSSAVLLLFCFGIATAHAADCATCAKAATCTATAVTITEKTCTTATVREYRTVRSWRARCGHRGPRRLVARVHTWRPLARLRACCR